MKKDEVPARTRVVEDDCAVGNAECHAKLFECGVKASDDGVWRHVMSPGTNPIYHAGKTDRGVIDTDEHEVDLVVRRFCLSHEIQRAMACPRRLDGKGFPICEHLRALGEGQCGAFPFVESSSF